MDKKEYQALTIPRVAWNKETLSSVFGELIAQPLEPGFGITLGNALRRILLGGVEGSAVVSVIIKGVMHIVLNIKEIVVRNTTGKPGKMTLNVSGEATARVADIRCDEHLELVN